MSNSAVGKSATAGCVDELVQKLEALDLKIIDLESDLIDAKKQRKTISHYLEELRASKAPIRRLPNEIIAMVFEHHCEDQKDRNATLMRVCKMWYNIVMNTPTLWNNIILTLFTIEDLPKIWSYAYFCLARSGKALLDVVLDADDFQPVHPFQTMASAYRNYHDPKDDKIHEQKIAEYLAEAEDYTDLPEFLGMYEGSLLMTLAILRGREDQFLSRWRRLSVYVSFKLPYTVAYNLWNSIDGATKQLTHLGFHGTYRPPNDWEQTGFPNLERLKVLENEIKLDFSRAAVHLQQLRLICDRNWASILQSDAYKFISLTLLHISFSNPARNFKSTGHINLPALQALVLLGDEGSFTILQLIKAPSLTHLSLTGWGSTEFTSCSLLNTVTDLLWDCKSDLETLLRVTPALERIHLPDGSGEENLLRVMDLVGIEGRDLVYCAGNCHGWPYIYPLKRDLLDYDGY